MNRTTLACLLVPFLLAVPVTAQEERGDGDSVEERLRRLELATGIEQETEEAEAGWSFLWNNGFRLESPDGDLSFKFGGRIQNDWAFYDADRGVEAAVGPFDDGTEFRRARLFFSGELYDRLEFKAQYDFAGGAEVKDLYVGLLGLPGVGGLRVGHYKEPFSLEEQTSSKYVTFLERGLPVEAFSPGRNTGFMLHDAGDRYTWAVGAFRDADDFGDAADTDEVNLTGRVTFLPWYRDGGSRMVHLGLSASEREPTGDAVRFRSRPESHLAPRFVDTSSFAADGVTLVDLEGALVHGPFSVQSEYIVSDVSRLDGPDPELDSFYVFGSWFLTGEHRRYKTSAGAFDRLKPNRPWGWGSESGFGAWEVALRYSTVDLTDTGLDGGELDDITLGLNWYPYANVRWMLNYVMSDLDGAGDSNTLQMRFQVDF